MVVDKQEAELEQKVLAAKEELEAYKKSKAEGFICPSCGMVNEKSKLIINRFEIKFKCKACGKKYAWLGQPYVDRIIDSEGLKYTE